MPGSARAVSNEIFISFSSKDRKVAMSICGALENRGFSCWISARNVPPGQNYQEAISRAIRSAKVMLLVFTANSNNSDEIKKEISLASRSKLAVIPLRVEDVLPSDAFDYEFATRQWIDLFDDWEESFKILTDQIATIVPPRPLAPESVETMPPPTARAEPAAPPSRPDSPTPEPRAEAGPRVPFVQRVRYRMDRLPAVSRPSRTAMVWAGGLMVVALVLLAGWNLRTQLPAPVWLAREFSFGAARPVLADNVQLQVDFARAAEKSAREKAAEAQQAESRAERAAEEGMEAAEKAKAHMAGYGILLIAEPDGGTGVWQWAGQVAGHRADGVGELTDGVNAYNNGVDSTNGVHFVKLDQDAFYKGEVHGNKIDGVGVRVWPNARYTGEWRNNEESGVGVMIWTGGDRVEGAVVRDASGSDGYVIRPGVESCGSTAKCREQAGSTSYEPGKMNGYGVEYEKDGTVKLGNWFDGALNGPGATLDSEGRVIEQGLYDLGKLKTAMSP